MSQVVSGTSTPWLTRNTVLLALASLFADIATEMLYPILPVFLTQTLLASGSIIGLIDGIAQATQNIIQGFSGWLSDRLQQRKTIALAGYFLAAISKPLIGAASAWPAVLVARVFDRVGAGLRSAPRDALIASSVGDDHRGKAFGLEGMGDNLGAFLGPLLTVLLLTALAFDLRSIFALALAPGLLAFVMILLVREPPSAAQIEAKARIDVDPRQFPRAYWIYLLVTALFGLGNSSNAFLILQTQDAGASLETTILIYAGFNLVAALISYPAGYFSDLWGRKTVLLLCFLIFTITYLGFALTRNTAGLGLLFIFYGLYQGIFRSVGKAFASDFAPPHLHASAIGWYSATIGLLQLFASLMAGVLWDRVGHQAVFFYGAFFAAIGSLALALLIPGKSAAHR
ncbi:MFS transporter [Beijerinckia indica]|uniref:Major facilitator superfamily MFS_1 n=1 Tax=Beijerinckia indica subsp. indica (strain ATCC 9039 / DSM 1715 / NCIMB 8712) TaxID=395963 RepID=B2IJ56_BEII9|nr:MFS transporter [Beijerinckia indica]ACB94819.1 major facilitator superfamily MFS_1 [Beijerinckia indica subsp. indica ATCC 9039]